MRLRTNRLEPAGDGFQGIYTKTRRPWLILREFQRDIHSKNLRSSNEIWAQPQAQTLAKMSQGFRSLVLDPASAGRCCRRGHSARPAVQPALRRLFSNLGQL